jgi:hypothetical protein
VATLAAGVGGLFIPALVNIERDRDDHPESATPHEAKLVSPALDRAEGI